MLHAQLNSEYKLLEVQNVLLNTCVSLFKQPLHSWRLAPWRVAPWRLGAFGAWRLGALAPQKKKKSAQSVGNLLECDRNEGGMS